MSNEAARAGAPAWKRFLPLGLLAAAAAAIFASGAHRYLSFDALVTHHDTLRGHVSANIVLAALVFMGIYAAAVAMSLPGGLVLTVTGGFLFGGLLGGGLVVVAATIGATLLFLIARTAAGETLARKAGPALAKIGEGFRKDAWSYLFFLRLVPAFPFFLVNLAPALFGVPLATFVVTTFLGIIPGTFAYAFAGAGFASVVQGQSAAIAACRAAGRTDCGVAFDARAVLTPELITAFVALGVVALIPVVLKRLRRAPEAS
jgi:uncharacterized membrane protein YdjX (TVP38/TMEM64 family)